MNSLSYTHRTKPMIGLWDKLPWKDLKIVRSCKGSSFLWRYEWYGKNQKMVGLDREVFLEQRVFQVSSSHTIRISWSVTHTVLNISDWWVIPCVGKYSYSHEGWWMPSHRQCHDVQIGEICFQLGDQSGHYSCCQRSGIHFLSSPLHKEQHGGDGRLRSHDSTWAETAHSQVKQGGLIVLHAYLTAFILPRDTEGNILLWTWQVWEAN